jgi:hypothetical protein
MEELMITKEKPVWKKNEHGYYRVFLDGIEFRGMRQARIHLKKKHARAKRRSLNK